MDSCPGNLCVGRVLVGFRVYVRRHWIWLEQGNKSQIMSRHVFLPSPPTHGRDGVRRMLDGQSKPGDGVMTLKFAIPRGMSAQQVSFRFICFMPKTQDFPLERKGQLL
jgi:hypothetical protein